MQYIVKTKLLNTAKNKFYAKILLPNENGCMIWTGTKNGTGYGVFQYKMGYFKAAHRFSYELHYGKNPENLFVCHSCDTPLCVAPDHLFLGTAKDNVRDKIKKNRAVHASGENHARAKLTDAQVLEIKEKLKKVYTIQDIAREYKVSSHHIYAIRQGYERS